MIKITKTYTDYLGTERTEDFYFHLTKAELMELELSKQGGVAAAANRAINAKNQVELIKIFKELVVKSYGELSADGRRHIKNPEVLANFMETEAYSMIFTELATNAEAASKFVNGIVPADLQKEVEKEIAKQKELEAAK